jgi:hypothetical protein
MSHLNKDKGQIIFKIEDIGISQYIIRIPNYVAKNKTVPKG